MGQNPTDEEEPTSELADIMLDVASELSDDFYDMPETKGAADAPSLDSIDNKLVDDADDFDLQLGDDAAEFNLLDDPESPESILQLDSGLSYEEPAPTKAEDNAANDFASQLEMAQNIRQEPAENDRSNDEDSFLEDEDDDPILRLEEDLDMNNEANSGKILPIAALVAGILALLGAGFATWQALGVQAQVSELTTLLSNQSQQGPDPKVTQLEGTLTELNTKLIATSDKISATEALLSKQQEQISKTQDQSATLEKLDKLVGDVSGLGTRLDANGKRLEETDKRLSMAISELKSKQDRIRTEQPKAAPSQPQPAVDEPKLESMGLKPIHRSTQPPPKKGPSSPRRSTSRVSGWVVNLISLRSQAETSRVLKRLQKMGIFPRKKKVFSKGKTWYRLYVDGFGNKTAARQYMMSVKGKRDLGSAWISREN